MINNKSILKILDEYDIDYEGLCECVAITCRKLYGVVEVGQIQDGEILAFTIGADMKLAQKSLKLTTTKMLQVIKGTIKEIELSRQDIGNVSKMLSYKPLLDILESDIFNLSKKKVSFKILSSRELYKKEKIVHPHLKQIVIVRANRFLEESERKFFTAKTSLLKQGVLFVLD